MSDEKQNENAADPEQANCAVGAGSASVAPLERRTWCYAQQPNEYDIAPCSCGNRETQWSEYKGHLWCAKCEKDFVPEHNGVFDGPILVGACRLMGISFDRVNLETQTLEIFDEHTNTYSALNAAVSNAEPKS